MTVEGCTVPCIDGVFVLDVSKSIKKTEFNDMKDFTLSIINLMNVSPECSRAGLILFAGDPWIKFALNEHLTPTRLRIAIDQIKYTEHSRNGTNIPAVLRLLRTAGGKNGTLGLRDGKIHIAVFISDGKNHPGKYTTTNQTDQKTKLAADELYRARFYDQIYAIGIKENQKTLSYIADPPSLAFSLAGFNRSLLNQVRINISKDLCDGELNHF